MKCVIVNDTSYEAHHGCEVVVKNIIENLQNLDIEVLSTNPVGKDWNNQKFISKIKKSDFIVVNAEGTIHHSQSRAKQLVKISKFAKSLDKKIFLINATIEKNDDEIMEYLKLFDLIFVRESKSFNELKKYNISSEIVPDMTFYTKFDLTKKEKTSLIGVTDSVYNDLSYKLYKFALDNNYLFLPILKNIKINNFKDVLRKIKWSIKADYRKKFYLKSYNEYINKIASLKFLITARFHALTFCLKTLTPFCAIKSNSHKIEGILEDIGLNDRICNLDNIKIKEFSNTEKEKVLEYVNQAPLKIENMFQKIKNEVNI